MKSKVENLAKQIITNCGYKQNIRTAIDNYDEALKDIIIIFVTDKWEVDAFWNRLEFCDIMRVLKALYRGMDSI